MHKTIVEALHQALTLEERGLTFINQKLEPCEMVWSELANESLRRGRYFRSLGLVKGDRIGLIIADQKEFVLTFLGIVSQGMIPVPMYPPFMTGIDVYLSRVTDILRVSEARHLVAFKGLSNFFDRLKERVPSLQGLTLTETLTINRQEQYDAYSEAVSIDSSDVCFLQFTSGSTAAPKGVIVSYSNIYHNIQGIQRLFGSDAKTDIGVSWLPMYHDMGLIGAVLTPVLALARCIYIPTSYFAMRPRIWLETVDKYRATFTSSSNFGLELVSRHTNRVEDLDLSCLRIIVVGAEPINSATVENFTRTFSSAGLHKEVVTPSYGMAEATLSITTSEPKEFYKRVSIAKRVYEKHNRVELVPESGDSKAIDVVSCGRTMEGHRVAIVDAEGELLPEKHVGEIVFKGPSVTKGYFNNADATRALFLGEWMRTGDLGFIMDGELYISGRIKDLIIIAGRNFYPQTIEWSAQKAAGIREGAVAAFSVSGYDTDRLVIVAECKNHVPGEKIKKRIRETVRQDLGLNPFDIVLIKPWTLPKTSSGKLKRRETKTAYETGGLMMLTNE